MIKLYRKENSQQADTIEAELRDLTLVYNRVVVAEQEAKQMFGEEASLPVIMNKEQVVSGQEIAAYLQELRGLRRGWQRSQSDSYYIDEDERFC
ncbi:MAG TPA: hypothetical protein VHP14_26490 [Anaerolineales bacterium]|nr:hypothetical protein [Anaerolineales bacterium]